MLVLKDSNNEKSIDEIIIETKNELRPILSNREEQTLKQAEKNQELKFLQRQKIKPIVKTVILHTLEHYRESIFDFANIQCDIMNWIWSGYDFEHIKGATKLDELKQNRRLMNYVCERVINKLCDDTLTEWQLSNLWIGESKY